MATPDYQQLNYWFDSLAAPVKPRSALSTDRHCDIAIIGAGYTGLWCAYYLKKARPTLDICIVEKEVAGYGASGRNGGWLMGDLQNLGVFLQGLNDDKREHAIGQVTDIVNEVERVCRQEQIDCDLARGGALYAAARFPEQLPRAQGILQHYHSLGFSTDDYYWLDKDQAAQQVNVRNALGAVFTPHVAAIHPAKLVRGLGHVVEAMGVRIYEQTPCTRFTPGLVEAPGGVLRADIVIPALEGYAGSLPSPLKRHTIPVVSRIIATEPLTTDQWQEIGFAERQVFCDSSRLVSYLQRTADGRLLFGARGSYAFGGKVRLAPQLTEEELRQQHNLMVDFFPALENVQVTHDWCGNLGMSRRMRPHAIFDPSSGIGLAGGYGGEGVGASNLMARTLADLILEKDSELTAMPWAHRARTNSVLRQWEPEPIPWLVYKTVNSIYSAEEAMLLKPVRNWKTWAVSGLADMYDRLLDT
ncbi:FAD-dependent oxidoreductase [Biformimicrobium ophioploci]|uniref:FAD-binding oxidoreductase n=1 Tax=Biformimicrobium ophioploci TaxID=3036711 RepID=A0ABQ6M318_9GAMM|nr:FAD-dependent oxidoreductase [Microbulbifer sp. NKW57]GMG88670.1 FAD-binding oxidoreductase [Microbulbifer sp. NKW57]